MKIIATILPQCALWLSLFLVSCSKDSPVQMALSKAELLMEGRPDSALTLLQSIDYSRLTRNQQACYGLLLTQARFKLYQPIDTDSLITFSIDYFRQYGDQIRLATSLYYKAVVIYELGHRIEAVAFLKEAERLAEQLDDELLKNKVYDSLEMINEHAGLYEEALGYARRFQQSSKKMNDSSLMFQSFNNLYFLNQKMGVKDSAHHYLNLLKQNMSLVNDMNKVIYLANIAYEEYKSGHYDEAKSLIAAADTIAKRPAQTLILGNICKKAGDISQAIFFYERLLDTKDPVFTPKACHLLAQIHLSLNDYPKAYLYKQMGDSMDFANSQQRLTVELSAIQKKYDQAVVQQQLYKRTIYFIIAGILFTIITLLLAVLIYRYKIKAKQYKSEISKKVLEIAEYKDRINLLQSSEQSRSQEKEALLRKVEDLSKATTQWIARGKLVYEKILAGEQHPFVTNDDERCFVDYFILENYDKYQQILREYSSLSLRQTIYLFLQRMGYDDNEVIRILNIAKGTIRTYRFRLAQQKKTKRV